MWHFYHSSLQVVDLKRPLHRNEIEKYLKVWGGLMPQTWTIYQCLGFRLIIHSPSQFFVCHLMLSHRLSTTRHNLNVVIPLTPPNTQTHSLFSSSKLTIITTLHRFLVIRFHHVMITDWNLVYFYFVTFVTCCSSTPIDLLDIIDTTISIFQDDKTRAILKYSPSGVTDCMLYDME